MFSRPCYKIQTFELGAAGDVWAAADRQHDSLVMPRLEEPGKNTIGAAYVGTSYISGGSPRTFRQVVIEPSAADALGSRAIGTFLLGDGVLHSTNGQAPPLTTGAASIDRSLVKARMAASARCIYRWKRS